MSDKKFDFNVFIADSVKSLQDPTGYFGSLKTSGGFEQPVIKALIYGAVAGIINYIWVVAGLSIAGFGLFGAAAGPMMIFGSVIGALIGLFIGGVIMLIFSAICSGNTDYEANVRVTASLMVLMPVSAVVNLLHVLSPVLVSILSIAINAYGLWMLYNALIQTLKAKESSVKVLVIVLLVIFVFFALLGLLLGTFVKSLDGYNF